MPFLKEDLEWKARWEERGRAVRKVLGESLPPDSVVPFSWKEYTLPGACALTFGPCRSRDSYLYMTLGLSQPLKPTDPAYPWEFAIRANEHAEWPVDLLYQLVTQWLWEKGDMGFGYHLPLVFFKDRGGKLWAGITNELDGLNLVGSIRGLYLWTDEGNLRFTVSSGEFSLLTAVAVTGDEQRLAEESTPAHLLLLLQRMGLNQVCDPHRESVLVLPGVHEKWQRIQALSHDDAFRQLQGTV